MKRFALLIVLMAAVASCLTLEDSLSLGSPRGSRTGRRMTDSTSTEGPPPVPDTVMWFTAVKFAPGYDWRQDSAYYSQDGEILLYKDFKLAASARIGLRRHVSADADLHHIIGGRLVTEYADASRTYIGINGEEVLHYDGPEHLCGFMEEDGHVFTLGKRLDREGFALRKDGVELFSAEEGIVTGNLEDQAFGEGGALYLDMGELCFAYSENDRAHLVCGGRDSVLCETGDRYPDIRRHNAVAHFVSMTADRTFLVSGTDISDISENGSVAWDDARLYFNSDEVGVAGKASDPLSRRFESAIWQGHRIKWLKTGMEETHIYHDGSTYVVLGRGTDGRMTVTDTVWRGSFPEGRFYFFHTGCACFCDAGAYVTLSPLDRDGYPAVWHNGSCDTLKINGFLTGIKAASIFPGDDP